MRLDDLRQAQMQEIMEWAKDLDSIITPDKLCPTRLKEYPLAMETSDKMKRICKWKLEDVKDSITAIEDAVMDNIEQQEYVYKLNSGGMPMTKKKFNTADKRKRELRVRLAEHAEYQNLKNKAFQWEQMYGQWIDHINRLRREFKLMEADYLHNGAQDFN